MSWSSTGQTSICSALGSPASTGATTLAEIVADLETLARSADPPLRIEHVQSNHEGILVDAIQTLGPAAVGIIINPGGTYPLQHCPARWTGRSRHSDDRGSSRPIFTRARSSAIIPWSLRSFSARSPVSARMAIGSHCSI